VTTRVLFVGGEGRSGSTVLSMLLGATLECVPVGEIHNVWNCVVRNELCACGQPFHDCEFWSAVGRIAFGGWDCLNAHELLEWDRRLTRHRSLVGTQRHARTSPMTDYRAILSRLYGAVQQVSDQPLVVDASKDAPWAFLLRDAPGISMQALHLVRDSRGVTYSWSKSDVPQPQYANLPGLRHAVMKTRRPMRACAEWVVKNLLLHWLAGTGTPSLFVRYESVMANPRLEVERIARFAGVGPCPGGLDQLVQEPPRLNPSTRSHMLGGNRVRFERGPLYLEVDNEWRRRMSPGTRTLVSFMTAPLLGAYGYLNAFGRCE